MASGIKNHEKVIKNFICFSILLVSYKVVNFCFLTCFTPINIVFQMFFSPKSSQNNQKFSQEISNVTWLDKVTTK
jgi:hypothetical protein